MSTRIPLTLKTERLNLRQFRPSDYDSYKDLVADAEVMRYVGLGKALDATQAWQNLALVMGHWYMRGFGLWAVERRDQPGLIGRAGLYKPQGWPGLEIGWLLQRDCWGYGYATEAAWAVKAVAAEVLHKQRLISLIHPHNERSAAVAKRLHGRLQGQIEILQQKVDLYRYY